jgi:hypothetical protein
MRGLRVLPRDPLQPPVPLEMHDGGFVWIELLRTHGPDAALLWRHPRTGEPWPMRIGASVDVRVLATGADGARSEVACGEIKYPYHKMYEPARDHVHPVHERDRARTEHDDGGFVDEALPAKDEYLAQQVVQMAVQGVPASLHVVLFPGLPAAPDARAGYATAHVLHFSPTLFDAIVTCAARNRLVETLLDGPALRRALQARRPASAAKRAFDAAAAAAGAVAPACGGWRAEFAAQGAYCHALPRRMWERAAVEVCAVPLHELLNDPGARVDAALARATHAPAEALALAQAPDNALFLPAELRATGWPRMDARLRAHVAAVHAAEAADPEFWRAPDAPGLLPPPPRDDDGLDGPWIDPEPADPDSTTAAAAAAPPPPPPPLDEAGV